MNALPASIRTWLRRLDWALQAMPAADRADIVNETRSHIEERLAAGTDAEKLLASLGRAEDYAREFLEDFELSYALGSRKIPRMVGVAASRMHRSLLAFGTMVWVAVLGILVASVLLTAVMHLIDPQHWGVWTSSHMFLIGRIDSPEDATEMLGSGIYLLAATCLGAGWLVIRQSLIVTLRKLNRQKSGQV